jgi:hypothetical protein
MKNFKLLAICFLVSIAFSCSDDDDFSIDQGQNPTTPGDTTTTPGNGEGESIDISNFFGPEIQDDFFGRVIDENENPLVGVQITIGSEQATTDENGVFKIDGADVNEDFAYVKAVKNGYVNASRSLVPVEGTNNVKIMMFAKEVAGTVQSGSSSSVDLDDGSKVEFSGEFVTENGTAYSGSVDVIAHHLNPNDENFNQQTPGMLYGANTDNEERLMQTFGQMSVELRGENGEDLNLANGSPATLTFTMDTDMAAEAPETIPLWYFDEEKGYWIEQGEATLQNGEYVGEVSHFSFWNGGVAVEAVELSLTIEDQNGNALSGLGVRLTSINFGSIYGYGLTNVLGNVSALVPSGDQLNLSISTFYFGFAPTIYTVSIGSFSSDEESTVTIDFSNIPDYASTNVQGNLNDCDGNNVSNGYFEITYQNFLRYYALDNGNFSPYLVYQNSEANFNLKGIDSDNQQSTGELNFTFTPNVTTLGNLTSCQNVEEYLEYEIDGGETVTAFSATVTDSIDLNNSNGSYLSFYGVTSGSDFISLFIILDQPIENSYPYFIGANNEPNFRISGPEIDSDVVSNADITLIISNFGAVGDYIDLTFQGTYDYLGESRTISGSAHVLREDGD